MKARAWLHEYFPESMVADGFDAAILGVAVQKGRHIVIYDRAAGHFVGAVQARAQGADLISRVAKRQIDWRRGRRLGHGGYRRVAVNRC